jgi:hypothetical protein
MIRVLLTATFIAAFSATAHADMLASEVVDRRKEPVMKIVINSIYQGIAYANADVELKWKGVSLYCLPAGLVLTTEPLLDLVARHTTRYPQIAGAPIGAVLLQALEDSFPCRNSN